MELRAHVAFTIQYRIYSTYLETPQRKYDKLSTYKTQQNLQNVCRNFVGKHTKNLFFLYVYTVKYI